MKKLLSFAGLQHVSGSFPPTAAPSRGLRATHPQNPNPVAWLWRAFFDDMDAWVREGSRRPRVGILASRTGPSSHPPPSVFRHALAALRLVKDRFLLFEDLADVLARGGAEWDEAMK